MNGTEGQTTRPGRRLRVIRWRRPSITLSLAISLACVGVGSGVQPALGSALCVAHDDPACFPGIQGAIDAASDGDTITIGPGTFGGGITIDKSVELVGAGRHATIIDGGGPVITIGTLFAATEPTVSVARVTVTGGLTESSPYPFPVTEGGGIWIPPGEDFSTGATVTITGSLITGNRVAPTMTDPDPSCGPLGCAFANGGGISNSGTLTITGTKISDNAVGPSVAHEAAGGGVRNHGAGTLTMRRSFVTDNRVIANAPNGVYAIAGGISDLGVLTIEDSVVSGNSVTVDAAISGEATAFTGGIELNDVASARITRTIVRDNRVEVTNADGPAFAGSGGISSSPDVFLRLRDSIVARNHVSASVGVPGAGATAYAGGIEIQGNTKVTGSRFIDNEVEVFVPDGEAISVGGGIFAWAFTNAIVSDSVVRGNSVSAASSSAFAVAAGGGVFNAGDLTLLRTFVSANVASAGGVGLAQGGGVWNGVVTVRPDFPSDVHLKLIGSGVTGNTLTGSGPEIGLEGAGIFSDRPITLGATVVAGNQPDQCFGC